MTPDETLILAAGHELASRGLLGVAAGKAGEELASLVDAYRVACRLSRGADPKRADHWRLEAVKLERQLRRRVDGEACE